jgi:hypothetical protein
MSRNIEVALLPQYANRASVEFGKQLNIANTELKQSADNLSTDALSFLLIHTTSLDFPRKTECLVREQAIDKFDLNCNIPGKFSLDDVAHCVVLKAAFGLLPENAINEYNGLWALELPDSQNLNLVTFGGFVDLTMAAVAQDKLSLANKEDIEKGVRLTRADALQVLVNRTVDFRLPNLDVKQKYPLLSKFAGIQSGRELDGKSTLNMTDLEAVVNPPKSPEFLMNRLLIPTISNHV